MNLLSIIVPAYNEQEMAGRCALRLREVMEGMAVPYEIIFVDDGSRDNTWQEIQKANGADPHVRGIRFSRNFGKESAIFAGLKEARGDAAAVLDCDLQHPPEKLAEMVKAWEEGAWIVEGIKEDRGRENLLHRKAARIFYRIMTRFSGHAMADTSDFKLLDRKAIDAILSMPERNMFFRATTGWLGGPTATVTYQVAEREAGRSKWSPIALTRYALNNIAAFTTFPLQIITVAGFICFFCSLLLGIYSLGQYIRGRAVEGYTTLIIVILFIGSAIMISLGVIGYYMAKIYEEVRCRPRYLIADRLYTRSN